MKKISNVVVHCSDSSFGSVNLIREWHKARGWKDIGYHFVILNGRPLAEQKVTARMAKSKFVPRFEFLIGSVDVGRLLDYDDMVQDNEVGSHALGYNANSIGVCLIGPNPYDVASTAQGFIKGFAMPQITALVSMLAELCMRYDLSETSILGHGETADGKKQGKTCPNIDMNKIRTMVKLRVGAISMTVKA